MSAEGREQPPPKEPKPYLCPCGHPLCAIHGVLDAAREQALPS